MPAPTPRRRGRACPARSEGTNWTVTELGPQADHWPCRKRDMRNKWTAVLAVVAGSITLAPTPVLAQGQVSPGSQAPPGQGRGGRGGGRGDQTPAVTGPWSDKTLSPDRRADPGIEGMTLDEKIQLVHGGSGGGGAAQQQSRSNGGAGFVPGIPRLGIPDINMADSAVG